MNPLLRDEDTIRRSLLAESGEDPLALEQAMQAQLAAQASAPTEKPIASADPEPVDGSSDPGPGPDVPGVDVPGLADRRRSEQESESRASALKDKRSRAVDLAIENIYKVGTKQPMYFDHSKAKSDPLLDLKRQQMLADLALKRNKLQGGGLSDEDRAMQDALLQDPELAKQFGGESVIRRMSGKSVEALFKQGDRTTDNRLQGSKFEQQKLMDAEKVKQYAVRANMAIWAAERVQDRGSAAMLQKYGEQIKTDVPIVSALEQIERRTLRRGPDGKMESMIRGKVPAGVDTSTVPTLGVWDKIKLSMAPAGSGSQFTEQDTVELQAQVKMLNEMFARGLAGAQFTPEEMKRFTEILNDKALGTPEAMAMSIDLVRRITATKLRQKEAAFSGRGGVTEQSWKEYAANGGVSTRSPVFSDLYDVSVQAQDPRAAPAVASPNPALLPQAQPQPVDESMPPGVEQISTEQAVQELGPDAAAQLTSGKPTTVRVPPTGPGPGKRSMQLPAMKIDVGLNPGEVEMIAPDGSRHAMQQSEVAEALQHNWKRASP